MKSVRFMPRYAAEVFKPSVPSVLISIHDESENQLMPQGDFQDVLYLKFHDTDDKDGVLTPFSQQHANDINSFLERNSGAEEVVVHCTMGISRSAAVAIFLSEKFDVPCHRIDQPNITWKNWPQYNKLVYRVLMDNELRQSFDEDNLPKCPKCGIRLAKEMWFSCQNNPCPSGLGSSY